MYIGLRIFFLQRLNADVGYNNNALKEFYDCIGGLLHLGLYYI